MKTKKWSSNIDNKNTDNKNDNQKYRNNRLIISNKGHTVQYNTV